MHSTTSRLNAIFGFMLSVLSAVTFLCFLSTAFRSYVVPFSVTSSAATVKSLPAYAMGAQGKADLAAFTFDLQADFRPLFDWNTKELFIYLYAEYKTPENALNQVIIWDKIILRENPQDHVVNIKNGRMKYYLLDDGEGLKGHDNVTLILAWNVIPNAGRMPFFTGIGSHHLSIPDKYSTGRIEL